MQETMTVHKALAELKTIDGRIGNALEKCEFAVANKHSNEKVHGVSIAEFVANQKANYQAVRTLINRRNAIKRAVTRSNAVTMVKIGDEEYTVAEAIDMKANGVKYLQSIEDLMSTQLSRATRLADAQNEEQLSSRADEYIKSLYAGSDLKNMSDEVRKVRDAFIAAQTVEILDPIDCQKEMAALEAKTSAFLDDVDAALSVSNALTTIEVKYETL